MNPKAILDMFMYPKPGDNIRTKGQPLFHNLTIATGTTNYPVFTSTPTKGVSNIKLPLTNQMYFVTAYSIYSQLLSTLSIANLGKLLMNSYLTVYVNGRLQHKWVLWELFNSPDNWIMNSAQTFEKFNTRRVRKLGYGDFFNSNSNVQITLVLDSAAATALNGQLLQIRLDGWLADKLSDFTYDELQGQVLQTYSDSIWQSTTYQSGVSGVNLFTASGLAANVSNEIFPLSDINTFQVEAIEFGLISGVSFNQMLSDAIKSTFQLQLNEVSYFNQDLYSILSGLSVTTGNITDSGANTVAYSYLSWLRSTYILDTPIPIGTVAKVLATIDFATDASSDTNPFIAILKGTAQRRVT